MAPPKSKPLFKRTAIRRLFRNQNQQILAASVRQTSEPTSRTVPSAIMKTNFLKELATKEFWLCVASEFFGCFFFLFVAAGSAVAVNPQNPPSVLHIGLATGLTISTLVMATLHRSGGLLNPAVSVGFVVARKISVLRGTLYIIAQVVGAIVGSAVLYGVVPAAKRGTLGTPMRASDVTTGGAFGVELVLTFLLVFVIFACTDPKRHHYGYEVALAIGVTVAVTNIMGIPISGGAINPARALGPAVLSNVWLDHWIYWVGPCLGGILAALGYNLVFCATEDSSSSEADTNEMPTKTKSYEINNIAVVDVEAGGRQAEN